MEKKYNQRAIIFALAALVTAVPAAAATNEERVSETVSYADLDLTSEAGIETLDRRLDRAVRRVCGSPMVKSVQSERRVTKCREQAWNAIRSERDLAIARAGERRLARASGESQTVVAHAE